MAGGGAEGAASGEPTSFSAGQLKALIERIERLEEEKAEIAEQIKEVYAEAKAHGFDTKTLRKVVGLRKKDPDERAEEETILQIYLDALGMGPREG
ncbi:MAG: DUF2312 domain-containing protein [Pseudomonadota bacterium]